MSTSHLLDLADCTEFRQTLQSRPPLLVHSSVLLLMAMIGSAVAWAALTKADLVVQGRGRVRPVETPQKVFTALGAAVEGRVVAVLKTEGDAVSAGEVLVRLDTERLDNDIARLDRKISAAEQELLKLLEVERLVDERFATARTKAGAELQQAQEDLRLEGLRRESERRQAEAALATARRELERQQKLARSRVITDSQLDEARHKSLEAEETLKRLRLPLDESKVEVVRQASALVERDFTVRKAELESQRVIKQGELEASRRDRANLHLRLEQSVLKAPVSGVIVKGDVKIGDVLEPGKSVFEIARQQGYRFEIEVSGDDVGHLHEGLPAQVRFDAYDHQKYGSARGRVCFISPDSTPPGESGGQPGGRFLVRIELDRNEVGHGADVAPIKLGLSGRAEIITDRERLLMIFLKKIRRTISLSGE